MNITERSIMMAEGGSETRLLDQLTKPRRRRKMKVVMVHYGGSKMKADVKTLFEKFSNIAAVCHGVDVELEFYAVCEPAGLSVVVEDVDRWTMLLVCMKLKKRWFTILKEAALSKEVRVQVIREENIVGKRICVYQKIVEDCVNKFFL